MRPAGVHQEQGTAGGDVRLAVPSMGLMPMYQAPDSVVIPSSNPQGVWWRRQIPKDKHTNIP